MRRFLVFAFLCLIGILYGSCKERQKESAFVNSGGANVKERIPEPAGYKRVDAAAGSFGAYLRNLPLRPHGSEVRYFDGRAKRNKGVYVAVVDMPIGNKDLHQCADAVMHLRAEYLYHCSRRQDIHFTFTNGFRADYAKWEDGYRIVVNGNKTAWVKTGIRDTSYLNFCKYLDIVYTYCGTLSLSKELKGISLADMEPGDVLIKGGMPGHAEIVLDVAENNKGRKVFLLAQSYMPAQEIQVLSNPRNTAISPWYELDETQQDIITPEWTFSTTQLMRFGTE